MTSSRTSTAESEADAPIRVQKVDSSDPRVFRYHELLTGSADRAHFPGVPSDLSVFITQLRSPSVHVLVASDERNKAAGWTIIRDAEAGQHDHWIERLIAEPALRGSLVGRVPGIGRRLLSGIVRWAFGEPTSDGRMRTKLDTAVVMLVPEWERVYRLFRGFGFEVRMINPNQADVKAGEETVAHDVVRMEFLRDNWRIPPA